MRWLEWVASKAWFDSSTTPGAHAKRRAAWHVVRPDETPRELAARPARLRPHTPERSIETTELDQVWQTPSPRWRQVGGYPPPLAILFHLSRSTRATWDSWTSRELAGVTVGE